jgi:hypothetical protein
MLPMMHGAHTRIGWCNASPGPQHPHHHTLRPNEAFRDGFPLDPRRVHGEAGRETSNTPRGVSHESLILSFFTTLRSIQAGWCNIRASVKLSIGHGGIALPSCKITDRQRNRESRFYAYQLILVHRLSPVIAVLRLR